METKVLIDGVWYVRADLMPASTEAFNPANINRFEGITYEINDYIWEVTRYEKKSCDGSKYKDLVITFKNKTVLDESGYWKVEVWDNSNWFLAIYQNNTDALNEAADIMNEAGIVVFRGLISYLTELGWLRFL